MVAVLLPLLLAGIVAAPFLIGLGWRRVASPDGARRVIVPRALLTLESVSYLWFLALMFFPSVIGPHYSGLRFMTIYGNGIGMLVVGIAACFSSGRARSPVVWGAVLVAASWLYAAVVSSVV